jgi:predicted neutral ceramidase superfamily lipid hydrolase
VNQFGKQMKNKRIKIIAIFSVVILLIPLIAMQFTDKVNWTPGDFVIAGALLLGTGLLCELALRKVKKISNRIALCGAILIVFLLVWAELAVGLFGTPFSGQ